MLQLPPDSHSATPDQSCVGAAEAGAARTPMPTAAAPRVTAPPRSRVRARVIELCSDMRDPPITACEVSCRVRANRCPACRVMAHTAWLHPETRGCASKVGPHPPSWSARIQVTGGRGSAVRCLVPAEGAMAPGEPKRDLRVSLPEDKDFVHPRRTPRDRPGRERHSVPGP